MKIEECRKDPSQARTVSISIRIDKETSEWIREQKLSPTAIFINTVDELKKQVLE